MKNFFINTGLFLFLYIPSTLLAGLAGQFFLVDGVDPNSGYEFFLWFIILLQLILPMTIALLLAYTALLFLSRVTSTRSIKRWALFVIPLSLCGAQWLTWGPIEFGIEVVLVSILPSVLLAILLRKPQLPKQPIVGPVDTTTR